MVARTGIEPVSLPREGVIQFGGGYSFDFFRPTTPGPRLTNGWRTFSPAVRVGVDHASGRTIRGNLPLASCNGRFLAPARFWTANNSCLGFNTSSGTPGGKMPGESKSSPLEIRNYIGRISGPLLDRIDLHVDVPPVRFREISGDRTGETSAQIRERVVAARQRQQGRFAHSRSSARWTSQRRNYLRQRWPTGA